MRPATNVRIVDRRLPEEQDRPFLPGTAKTWMLPFYDLMSRMAGIRALHERAADRAGISPGQTVVDFAPARDQDPGHRAGHGAGHALRHLSHLLRSRVNRGPRWPSTCRRTFRRFCVTPASGTPAR